MFQAEFDPSWDSVTNILRRRGLEVVGTGDDSQLLYPYGTSNPHVPHPDKAHSYTAKGVYFDCFGNVRFRKLMVKLLLATDHRCSIADAISIVGNKNIDKTLYLLTDQIRVAEIDDDTVVLTRPVPDLGASMEHYVAHLCQDSLRGRAEWGIKLKGLPSGGDFDVLAWLAPNLVYIECKSGNPRNIDDSQLTNFVLRHRELGADLSILLIDTDSQIDQMIENLNTSIRRDYQTNDDIIDADPMRRRGVRYQLDFFDMRVDKCAMFDSIWFGYHRVYVIGNQPSILTQIRRCLMHHHAYMKQHDLKIAKAFSG